MDTSQFAILLRTLAAQSARRRLLAGLTSSVLALAAAGDEAVAAKTGKCKQPCGVCQQCTKGKCHKTKDGKKRCKKDTCAPKTPGTACGSGGQVCQGGTCGCPGGTLACAETCVLGTCCPGTSCGGDCGCLTAIEGDTFCAANVMVLCMDCPSSGACAAGSRCSRTSSGATCCIPACGTV